MQHSPHRPRSSSRRVQGDRCWNRAGPQRDLGASVGQRSAPIQVKFEGSGEGKVIGPHGGCGAGVRSTRSAPTPCLRVRRLEENFHFQSDRSDLGMPWHLQADDTCRDARHSLSHTSWRICRITAHTVGVGLRAEAQLRASCCETVARRRMRCGRLVEALGGSPHRCHDPSKWPGHPRIGHTHT